jgi:hypothetical protein
MLEKDDGSLWIKERDGTLNPVTNQDFIDLQKEAGLQLTPSAQERFDELNRPLSPAEADAARRGVIDRTGRP